MKNAPTLRVLAEIRDGVRETNARVDGTNVRLDQMREDTNARLDELSRRVVASEIRTATAITELAHSVRDVATLLREQHDLRPRVDRCELEVAELKRRVPA